MMFKIIYTMLFAIVIAGLLYHFAALKVFSFIIPKDAESRQIGSVISYASGTDQTLYIFKPTISGGDLPTLIFVHGGSWNEGNAADYEFVGRAFAAKGFLTFVMNYRKHPQNPFPAFVEDVASATAWANQHASDFGGDGNTIFLVGHSAGAYNVALAVLDQHYMKDAGVDPKIIKGVATMAGPFDFLPLDSPATIRTFGQIKNLGGTQPINFASAGAPPFLILNGSADTTVYPRNAASLFKHLGDVGANARRIEYQDVSHVGILLDLAKPLRSNAPVLDDITKFFKDILKQ